MAKPYICIKTRLHVMLGHASAGPKPTTTVHAKPTSQNGKLKVDSMQRYEQSTAGAEDGRES